MSKLITFCGINPQLVVESLYYPVVLNNEHIDEIFIFLTDYTHNIMDKREIKKQIKNMYKFYNIKFSIPNFKFIIKKTSLIDDFERFFIEVLNDLRMIFNKYEDEFFYVSIAAGHKSVSIVFYKGVVLYANNAKIFHIISPDDFIRSKEFFPRSKDILKFIEIPFISLRDFIDYSQPLTNYIDIKKKTEDINKYLKKIIRPKKITIDLKSHFIKIGDNIIKLKPFNLAVYLFFLEKQKVIGGKSDFKDEYYEEIERIYRDRLKITRPLKLDRDFSKILKAISEIKKSFSHSGILSYHYYIIKSVGNHNPKHYILNIKKKNVRIIE